MKNILRRCLLGAVLAAGLAAMNYLAPLQPGPLFFDLALAAMLVGLISVLFPLRFLDIRSRWAGLCILIGGIAVAALALGWPPSVHTVDRRCVLDDFLPSYTSREFHSQLVHAPPTRVYRAIRETTLGDVKLFVTLMQLRMGRFRKVNVPPGPILDLMSRPGSPFLLLSDDGCCEIVLGIAGRFWGGGSARFPTAAAFNAYHEPGAAKSAFNFRVEDLGQGWSRVSTETRVIGNDPVATRTMTRYWRIIYPGSAAIRRMWLNAIKARAELPTPEPPSPPRPGAAVPLPHLPPEISAPLPSPAASHPDAPASAPA